MLAGVEDRGSEATAPVVPQPEDGTLGHPAVRHGLTSSFTCAVSVHACACANSRQPCHDAAHGVEVY